MQVEFLSLNVKKSKKFLDMEGIFCIFSRSFHKICDKKYHNNPALVLPRRSKMVKKIVALMALMLCVSVAVISLSGCAKKKAEQPAAEQAAPADSVQAPVDTAAVK
jgi:hypothetical protein